MNKEEKNEILFLTESIAKLSNQHLRLINHIEILTESVNKLAEGQLLFMDKFNKIFMPKDNYKDIVNISDQHDYIG